MKKIFFIAFFVCALLIGAFFIFYIIYENNAKRQELLSRYHLTPEELSLIKDGDIILRHGFGFVSDLIVKNLNEEYDISHCAIIRKEGNTFKVIHSVSQSLSEEDGVQSELLGSFVRTSHENSVIVVRFKAPDSLLHRISDRAEYYLKRKVPFDNSFNIEDSSEIYCSELIWLIIKNEFGVDIFKDKYNERKDHMKFSTFWDTSRFEIIINHHINPQRKSSNSY